MIGALKVRLEAATATVGILYTTRDLLTSSAFFESKHDTYKRRRRREFDSARRIRLKGVKSSASDVDSRLDTALVHHKNPALGFEQPLTKVSN